jgi:hypothetical protein
MALGEAIGGLVGGIAGLAGLGGKGGKSEMKQAAGIWKTLKESNFDFRSLTAPQLRVLGEMMPEVYSAIVPPEAQQITEPGEGREAQLGALSQVQDVAAEGLPAADRQAILEAQQAAAQLQQRGTEATLQNLAARGRLGGGTELAARLAAGSEGANIGADLAGQASAESALRRLAAAGQAGQMGGQLRGADVQTELANKQFVERFNELVAQMQTQAAAQNAAARERAQQYNLQTRQRVGEANPLLKYQTELGNIERQNLLRGQQFGQQATKIAGQSGALGQLGGYKEKRRAQNIGAITDIGAGLGGVGGAALGFGF